MKNLLGIIQLLMQAFLIKKTTELIFNKFTFEGKILRQQQIIGLLKDNSEIIEKYKELGFDIDPNIEEVEKVQSQIFMSIHRMVSRNTKIKINDDEIKLESSYNQKYLIESKMLLIEERLSVKNKEKETDD